jgi:hypothetical protein
MMKAFDRQRRKLLQYGFFGLGVLAGNAVLPFPVKAASWPLASLGELLPPDENGVRLPAGFTSRIVARSGQKISDYYWHAAPDGGAGFMFPTASWTIKPVAPGHYASILMEKLPLRIRF